MGKTLCGYCGDVEKAYYEYDNGDLIRIDDISEHILFNYSKKEIIDLFDISEEDL